MSRRIPRRGQGAFEYLLLLGGTVLVATVVTVMAQGSIVDANNAFNESRGDYSSYIEGGVDDLLANGSLVHEPPAGCVYDNPACDVGYFCNAALNVCTPITSVQLFGYVFDSSGLPLSGATVNVTDGIGSITTTDSSGRYLLLANVSVASGLYTVTASRYPANRQAVTTVNLSVGYATVQNFTLSYNDAALSGFVRDASSAGISGVNVSCGRYSTLSASGGAYALTGIPMTSVSVPCTLTGAKSPTVVSNSTPATLSAGLTNSKNLQLSYSPASLSGYVRNSTGSGVNGAAVSCGGVSGTTSSTGAYSLSGIVMSSATQSCTLSASKPPVFAANSVSVALSAGVAASQNLQLSYANAALSGYVRDASSAGVNGAAVSCAGRSATTTSNGSYVISGLAMSSATSSCTLAVSKSPTFVSNSSVVSLAAGVSASRIVTLSYSSASVSGYVRDMSGSAISGASVSCLGYSTTTSSDGSYSISGIAMSSASTTCTLSASKSGYTAKSATVSLSAGGTSSGQNLQLASSGFQLNFESGIGSWTSIMTSISCSYLYLNSVSAGRGAYSMESRGYNTGCGSAHATAVDYYMSPVSGNTFKFSLKWVQAGTPNYANYLLGIRGVNSAGAKKWMAYRFRYGHGGGGYGTWYFDWTYWHTDQCAMVDIVDPASGTWYDFTRTLSSDFSACGFVPVSYDAIGITEGAWAGTEYWYLDDVSIQ